MRILELCNMAFPEDISDMFSVVDERTEYGNDAESSSDVIPEEYLFDLSHSEESDIEY